MTSDFLSLISHGWVVTFQDSHRTVFTFRSWLDLLGVVLAFWVSILKISKLIQNCFHGVIDISSFEKHLESSLNFCQIFGDISFQEYLSQGISQPVFYGDLVYKRRRVKDTPNFFSSGSKIVKRLRRRQYDPVIIERTIGLVFGPSTALYEPFLKHSTLTNKAVGTIRSFVQTSEATGSWSLSPLIVRRDSFGHHTWARFQPGGAQPALFGCR